MINRKVGTSLFIFSFSFALLGCAGETSETGDEQGETSDEQEETSDMQEGGELNIAFHAQPSTLDPMMTTNLATRDVSHHIYESLVTVSSSLEVEPMLAESYDVSEDGETVTFHLREGVQFHNGEEVTADDVIASLERWQGLSTNAITYLEEVTFEAEDEYTVIAHNSDPTTLDMYIFADMTQFAAVMPAEIIEDAGAEPVNEYIGTGPYEYGEMQQDQYVHLTKFEDYQSRSEEPDALAGAKNAYVDDMYIHFVTDPSTRINGLQTGEYDLATEIPHDNVEQVEDNPELDTLVTSTSFPIMNFNKRDGVFTDQDLRHAANDALDMEALLTAAYGGEDYFEADHALATEEQTGWYTDTGSEVYHTYDPESVEQSLDEAGYDGEEIVILATRDRGDEYNMAVVAQQQMEAAGMNAELMEMDDATLQDTLDDETAWDISFTGIAFRPQPTQYIFLNSEWYGWTDSDEISQVSENILQADSQEDAQTYTDDMHEIFYEYLPVIKVGNSTSITAYGDHVEGLQFHTGPVFWNISMDE